MQGRRAAFAFIFITVALDMLALGVIVPVLPKLVLEFQGGDSASAATWVGVFGTIYAAMQFFFAPLLGALSDRFGRRPVVVLSNFGMAADYAIMAFAPSVAWLLLGRVLSGLCGATWTVAGAYIADTTPAEERAARFGIMNAAFGLGFVVGPAVGGLFGAIDPRLPFWVAAGLSLANGVYGTFVLPESLPRERRAPFAWRIANPAGAFALLCRHHVVLGLAIAAFLTDIAHEVNPTVFVLYTDYRYGWDTAAVGWAMAVMGVSSALVGALGTGPIVRWLGDERAVVVGLALGATSFAAQGLAPTGMWFAAVIPLGAFWAIWRPAAQQIMTAQVDASEQGRLQGAISAVQGVAFMIGPVLFAIVFAASTGGGGGSGGLAAPLLPAGASFLLAGLLLAIGAAIAWHALRRGSAR